MKRLVLVSMVILMNAPFLRAMEEKAGWFDWLCSRKKLSQEELLWVVQYPNGQTDIISEAEVNNLWEEKFEDEKKEIGLVDDLKKLSLDSKEDNEKKVRFIDRKNKDGRTLLHLIVCKSLGREKMETILKHGVAINAQDALGYTPLHYAALTGNCAEVALLQKYGADETITDKNGRTALRCASERLDLDYTYKPSFLLSHNRWHTLALLAQNSEHICDKDKAWFREMADLGEQEQGSKEEENIEVESIDGSEEHIKRKKHKKKKVVVPSIDLSSL